MKHSEEPEQEELQPERADPAQNFCHRTQVLSVVAQILQPRGQETSGTGPGWVQDENRPRRGGAAETVSYKITHRYEPCTWGFCFHQARWHLTTKIFNVLFTGMCITDYEKYRGVGESGCSFFSATPHEGKKGNKKEVLAWGKHPNEILLFNLGRNLFSSSFLLFNALHFLYCSLYQLHLSQKSIKAEATVLKSSQASWGTKVLNFSRGADCSLLSGTATQPVGDQCL